MNPPVLPLQTATVVDDGLHNAFTDLLYWRKAFWLIYVASPGHFASPKSRLVLLRSADAVQWTEVTRFSGNGKDIRDPKLAVIGDKLFLFALLNASFDPQPYATVFAKSADGISWSPFVEIQPTDWLLGRPKSPNGVTWFVSAHWREFNRVALLKSADGEHWNLHSIVAERPGLDETALEFLPDGRLLVAIRYEAGGGLLGSPQAGTLLVTSELPYDRWSEPVLSQVTRLDSPNLVPYNGNLLGVGRFQPIVKSPFGQPGSILSRKRTALFRVNEQKLTHLTDLPSRGDTAYAGVVVHGEYLYISYYTNAPRADPPWIVGMFRPTQVQITKIPLSALENISTN
jgi:hypothetical protein